jgi:hypothetical protein
MEDQKTPTQFDRHFFNTTINLGIIAPKKLTGEMLMVDIQVLIDNFLEKRFKVAKIALPNRPGMPGGEFIYELRDRMEDIR